MFKYFRFSRFFRFFYFFSLFCFFIFSYVFTNIARAETVQLQGNETKIDADTLKNNSLNAIRHFDPNATFDHFNPAPEETKYYKEDTHAKSSLSDDALLQKSNTSVGTDISRSIREHSQYVVTPTDSDIQHGLFVQSEADAIIHGVTDEYVDCQAKPTCQMRFEEKICTEKPVVRYQSCKKTLKVELIPQESAIHHSLIVHVRTKDHNYAGINVSAVTGEIHFIGPHDTTFTFDKMLPGNLDCNDLQGAVTQFNANHRDTHLDYIRFPACDNGMSLDFHLSGSSTIAVDMQIDITSKTRSYDTKDQWIDDCGELINEVNNQYCVFKEKSCTAPNLTKTINGVAVTRNCWEEQFDYVCHQKINEGNCTPLREAGCQQVNSICQAKAENDNHQCALFQQIYRCPLKVCQNTADIVCGNGKAYCLDGSCVNHTYQPSADFAKNVSALSALSEGSKQFDPATMTLFAGYPMECSEKPIGYSNCCTDKGWGQDIGLDHCPEVAKKLHAARENRVAVKVGRYCSGSKPFPCKEHSQTFCVFNSKLAKIIQEQGRNKQLHLDFGSAKHPNCLGITADQFGGIDLSKINFEDFYSDLQSKQQWHDIALLQQKIQQHVAHYKPAEQVND